MAVWLYGCMAVWLFGCLVSPLVWPGLSYSGGHGEVSARDQACFALPVAELVSLSQPRASSYAGFWNTDDVVRQLIRRVREHGIRA
jgi:hypothetical protein